MKDENLQFRRLPVSTKKSSIQCMNGQELISRHRSWHKDTVYFDYNCESGFMYLRFSLVVIIVVLQTVHFSALELPSIFSDHMILQRDVPVAVFGKGTAGSMISVSFGTATVLTSVQNNGAWRVDLPELEASAEGRTLEVIEKTVGGVETTKHFDDVLVGDVWHCSGQSNMEWPVVSSMNGKQEAASANFPLIRHFTVPKLASSETVFLSDGSWVVTTPNSIKSFSAVGYFFGRYIHRELGVPVGLIDTAWGGASAEAYVSYHSLRGYKPTRASAEAQRAKDHNRILQEELEAAKVANANKPEFHSDPDSELVDVAEGIASVEFDDSGWGVVTLPTKFEQTEMGNIDGVAWFRKQVELPKAMHGQPLTLRLGTVDDFDHAFVDGQLIGQTDKATEVWWNAVRIYDVPASLTEDGRITLAIRVFDHKGGGGFTGTADELSLCLAADSSQRITLAGEWNAKLTHPLSPVALRVPIDNKGDQYKPYHLYHGMIEPIAPFAHKGVLWYQGETNVVRAKDYTGLMLRLMDDWRKLWDQPGDTKELPFFIVQLANYQTAKGQPPANDDWADLRLAQMQIAKSDGHAWLAAALDLGEAGDIHPRNKQEVGRRLGLLALRHAYGKYDVVAHGPEFKKLDFNGNEPDRVVVKFEHGKELTTVDGLTPRGFAIRVKGGSDWVWATAEINKQRDVIELTAPRGMKGPFDVRYAYQSNPKGGGQSINLINDAELPALPFDTVWASGR